MTDAETTDHLVIVGASSGGIEAVGTLLSSLPADFGAPVVIAQHLDPRRPSIVHNILEKKSAIPVVSVDRSAKLEPAHAYVVAANRHVRIADGHIESLEAAGRRPAPSIDHLLWTAAELYGDRLISVILTGSGSDGASGAVEVKRRGGTVVIQNPATARYPSMPLSLPPTAVDHSVDLENIGSLLNDLVNGSIEAEEPAPDRDQALKDILAIAARQANIDFRPYKPSTILRRISRRMSATHCHDMTTYAAYLRNNEDEVAELVMAFLIKVTEFFRDPEAFEYLRRETLPAVIQRARERGHVLRLWSVGCATGEEPYSLAMLVSEALGDELPSWSIKIFATDVDEDAIDFARRGTYPETVLENLPEAFQNKYFERVEDGMRISKTMRQMVIFGQQDLSRGVPFPRIDLIVCRNVLIYFKPELQEDVLDLFAYSLYPVNGYLFLGKAETARPSQAKFELENKKWKVYACTAGASVAPRPGPSAPLARFSGAVERLQRRRRDDLPRINESFEPVAIDFANLRRFNEFVMRFLPIGITLIDRSYRIITVNPTARRLLGILDTINDHDFLHAVRGIPYAELREAIDTVFRERTQVVLSEISVETPVSAEPKYITLCIVPMQGDVGGQDLVVVSSADVTEQVTNRRRMQAAQGQQQALLEDLGTANRKLSELNKELQEVNEQLQSSNEEMMLTQEELQATNEEFEATNEELQATNEELETNNEELQATNEELEATNEELTARSHELQELTRMLTNERTRLVEMVELAPFYILVLRGPSLTVEAYNPRFEEIFEGRQAVGRSLDEVFPEAEMNVFLQAIRETYRSDKVKVFATNLRLLQGKGGSDRGEGYLRCSIVPSHEAGGRVDGVVVYAEDLTVEHFTANHLKDEFLALASHELRTPLVPLRGYAELIAERLEKHPDPEVTSIVEKMQRQIDHLSRLIGDIVDVSQLQIGKLRLKRQSADLCAVTRAAIDEGRAQSAEHSIELLVPNDGEPVPVFADEHRIKQAILVLIENAIRHAPDSKRISVAVQKDAAAGSDAPRCAAVSVRDYGPGVDPKHLASIFSRFFQAERSEREARGGLGLGLFIAKNIVEQHGGTLHVDSRLGEGASFVIRLPMA